MKKKKKNLVHKDFSGSSSTVTFTRSSHFASSAGLSMDNIGGFNCYNSLFVSQMFSFGPMSDGCNHALPRYGLITRMSIPYRRPYRFGHRYDIFRIPVNTGVPFRVYRYFIYLIYIYTHTHTYIHKISIYHKTIPQKFMFTIKHYFN